MTTIVAVQGKGWSVLGWDSRVVDGDGRTYRAGNNWHKVVRNNGYLIGAAGDVRAINIVHHSFNPPKPDEKLTGVKLDRFITSRFIPALRECFEREGYMGVNRRENAEEHGSEILISVNATVFEIGSDWAWVRDESNLYGIGTGSPFALGALMVSNLSSLAHAKHGVMESLLAASYYDNGTGKPFHTASQSLLL